MPYKKNVHMNMAAKNVFNIKVWRPRKSTMFRETRVFTRNAHRSVAAAAPPIFIPVLKPGNAPNYFYRILRWFYYQINRKNFNFLKKETCGHNYFQTVRNSVVIDMTFLGLRLTCLMACNSKWMMKHIR